MLQKLLGDFRTAFNDMKIAGIKVIIDDFSQAPCTLRGKLTGFNDAAVARCKC